MILKKSSTNARSSIKIYKQLNKKRFDLEFIIRYLKSNTGKLKLTSPFKKPISVTSIDPFPSKEI
jgi:hypothetical protein